MIHQIDFSNCSTEQIKELKQATKKRCKWLCERRTGEGAEGCYEKWVCPAHVAFILNENNICAHHQAGEITKAEIRRQCDAELKRREEQII